MYLRLIKSLREVLGENCSLYFSGKQAIDQAYDGAALGDHVRAGMTGKLRYFFFFGRRAGSKHPAAPLPTFQTNRANRLPLTHTARFAVKSGDFRLSLNRLSVFCVKDAFSARSREWASSMFKTGRWFKYVGPSMTAAKRLQSGWRRGSKLW